MKLSHAKTGIKYEVKLIENDAKYFEIFGIEPGVFIKIDYVSLFGFSYKISIESKENAASFAIPRKYIDNIIVL